MKRASLKAATAVVNTSAREDVTDRLLAGAPTKKMPAAGATRPKRTVRPKSSLGLRPEASTNTAEPSLAGGESQAALELTQRALAALRAAREAAPARYDLGARYRLDALAHHLEQVASYVLGQASLPTGG